MSSMHYFAADGNYGTAHELVIVDTSKWTEEDWDTIESANDWQRPYVAMNITAVKEV